MRRRSVELRKFKLGILEVPEELQKNARARASTGGGQNMTNSCRRTATTLFDVVGGRHSPRQGPRQGSRDIASTVSVPPDYSRNSSPAGTPSRRVSPPGG